jgi:hypothetical protein
MATIELRLSNNVQKETGRAEIMIRFFHNHIDIYAKSEVFINPDYFEYYIDRKKTIKPLKPIPANAITLNETQYAIKKKDNRDKGQRQFCGCMVSKDIGEYNTCPHLCEYCYANVSKDVAVGNWKRAKDTNWQSETITGK